MRLSNYQAILLTNVLYDSAAIVNSQMGGLSPKQRLELYNNILKQQNHRIIKLDDLPKNSSESSDMKSGSQK